MPPRSPQALGTLTQLHLQLLPFLIGKDSSVGEGGDPNQKEENRCPQKEPVWAARTQWVSGCPHLPKALSRSQSCCFSTACPGATWLTLLPIVYSEGVIHKNSRTTSLFPPLSLLLVLAPPSVLSSIKASELKALSAEGAQEAGSAARKVGGRPELGETLLHLPGVSGGIAPSSSVPAQPPSPAGHGVQATPFPSPHSCEEVTL